MKGLCKMKKSMTSYINDMTSGNLDTLEKIISKQYRKFVRFYNLIREYSSLISKLKYEFNSDSSLDILLYFETKRDLKNICSEIESKMDDSEYDGGITVSKKTMYISLILDEDND